MSKAEIKSTMKLGEGKGMVRAAKMTLDRACEAFRRGDDKESHRLRALYDEFIMIGETLIEEAEMETINNPALNKYFFIISKDILSHLYSLSHITNLSFLANSTGLSLCSDIILSSTKTSSKSSSAKP